MEPQNGKMMGWDVTVQRVRGGGRPVPKQVVGLAACRRYCLCESFGVSWSKCDTFRIYPAFGNAPERRGEGR